MLFPNAPSDLPRLTTDQMIEVDRLMIEDYGIVLLQMMEHAGQRLATLARERFLDHSAMGMRVLVLAGTGGNGGGAMVAARMLSNWGADVELVVSHPDELSAAADHQLRIAKSLGLPFHPISQLENTPVPDLILDGIIGYSLSGDPAGPAAAMIRWANAAAVPTLSLDTPSGLDLRNGKRFDPCIQADATLTLALPKRGLFAEEANTVTGELYLGDIGVPPGLYAGPSLGLEVGPLFAGGSILRIA